MILFNETTMSKSEFNRSFLLADNRYGIVKDDEDCPGEDFQETCINQECWILNDMKAEDCKYGAVLFVYIPEYNFATTVLAEYINQSSTESV